MNREWTLADRQQGTRDLISTATGKSTLPAMSTYLKVGSSQEPPPKHQSQPSLSGLLTHSLKSINFCYFKATEFVMQQWKTEVLPHKKLSVYDIDMTLGPCKKL